MASTYTVNKYGNILIESHGQDDIPENVPGANICIFKNFSKKPSGMKLLYDSYRHGKLYVTPNTLKNHPMIIDDTICGSCTVVFTRKNNDRRLHFF